MLKNLLNGLILISRFVNVLSNVWCAADNDTLPQFRSSLPSLQSLSRSQRHRIGMQ